MFDAKFTVKVCWILSLVFVIKIKGFESEWRDLNWFQTGRNRAFYVKLIFTNTNESKITIVVIVTAKSLPKRYLDKVKKKFVKTLPMPDFVIKIKWMGGAISNQSKTDHTQFLIGNKPVWYMFLDNFKQVLNQIETGS
jgi:hypothetical protein